MITHPNRVTVPSRLERDWVPSDAAVWVIVESEDGEHFDAIIPSFSIAAQGTSWGDAVTEAVELLEDYLILCKRDGLSFHDALRPLHSAYRPSSVATLSMVAKALAQEGIARIRHRRPASKSIRIPLGGVVSA